ncbi:MAG: tRNA (adenosine(37)-N6)-threonylcarbamoyltransferase complex transferase subunit TsaD [Bacteroidetes bacterium]|nr:tRNA (adenosine(37)-N6)-threonylcarbamoyltransferase complex transferase subunit TsaD [Bacteroidota bacterium]
MPVILGIESSCDDTAAAVIRDGKLLANIVAGQEVHKQWGGVIPELASRAHQQNIVPVIDQTLQQAGILPCEIDAIAFTRGPGLLGSLLVGASFAKGFASILGETIDDAAGETFDKTAKILGLPYPGGPLVDKLAKEGNPNAYKFPIAQIPGLDFSFSGLKTSVLYFVRDEMEKDAAFLEKNISNVCASVQFTIVKTLLQRVEQAMAKTGLKQIALAGGVSANSGLRLSLQELGKKNNWKVFIPPFEYCTDNAAMIAMNGYFKFSKNDFVGQDIAPLARLTL